MKIELSKEDLMSIISHLEVRLNQLENDGEEYKEEMQYLEKIYEKLCKYYEEV